MRLVCQRRRLSRQKTGDAVGGSVVLLALCRPSVGGRVSAYAARLLRPRIRRGRLTGRIACLSVRQAQDEALSEEGAAQPHDGERKSDQENGDSRDETGGNHGGQEFPKRGYSLYSSTPYTLWLAFPRFLTCLMIAWYGTGSTWAACCTIR